MPGRNKLIDPFPLRLEEQTLLSVQIPADAQRPNTDDDSERKVVERDYTQRHK